MVQQICCTLKTDKRQQVINRNFRKLQEVRFRLSAYIDPAMIPSLFKDASQLFAVERRCQICLLSVMLDVAADLVVAAAVVVVAVVVVAVVVVVVVAVVAVVVVVAVVRRRWWWWWRRRWRRRRRWGGSSGRSGG